MSHEVGAIYRLYLVESEVPIPLEVVGESQTW